MKLVEESSGNGELLRNGRSLRPVRYAISRYQGVMEGSGLPIPGLYRIEGSVDYDASRDSPDWIDAPLILRLEDGRTMPVTIIDKGGRILSEGHGPLKCMCC